VNPIPNPDPTPKPSSADSMGGVCVGGGGRAFYYTYIYSLKGQSCEGAELVGVLVAETIPCVHV
jgi:hypothetical protein